MGKKASLAEAMKRASGHSIKADININAEPTDPSQYLPPSRKGKKTVAGHFDPAVSRQLRQIALDEGSSVQELLREALNDLFIKKGSPPIA